MQILNWRKTAFVVSACLLAATVAPAQNFRTLHAFDWTDGSTPSATLVQAVDGSLYGTTAYGGANNFGTIFKISPDGSFSSLYSFCSQPLCADGSVPEGALIQLADGNFYGTAAYGGANGSGTVFKVTPSGTVTTLYSFCAQTLCADGANPFAALVQASDGNLYGTTTNGGANTTCANTGCGTVFRITLKGALTTLYSFCSQTDCADGSMPIAPLIQARDGNLYGTTFRAGAYNGGTIFRVSLRGTLTTLHTFCAGTCTDGSEPYAALVQAADGNLYGTTLQGGASDLGTVFKFTRSGIVTPVYSFCSQSGCTDGANPTAALVQAVDGNLYSTASSGGNSTNSGTVFKITPTGTLTTLYGFCSQANCTDGIEPLGLGQDTNGRWLGIAALGGTISTSCNYGCGTVFGLSVGLGPFVKTVPILGSVGKSVTILGTKLTGATSVTFNGVPATFTVESATAIKTTVPAGATTGPVKVATPSGTLTSNVNFQVLP